MSDWQPIETAPKDGTKILVWDGETMATVSYAKFGAYWSLCAVGDYASFDNFDCPTHWTPLPPPPT